MQNMVNELKEGQNKLLWLNLLMDFSPVGYESFK